jgi:low temperature requirement protein LtrA
LTISPRRWLEGRVDLAVGASTCGHFPLVAGIVLAALGVEGVLAHAGEREPLVVRR